MSEAALLVRRAKQMQTAGVTAEECNANAAECRQHGRDVPEIQPACEVAALAWEALAEYLGEVA
jgi:hypothetical protein